MFILINNIGGTHSFSFSNTTKHTRWEIFHLKRNSLEKIFLSFRYSEKMKNNPLPGFPDLPSSPCPN